MGKFAPDIFYAEGFDGIENTVTRIVACSAQPTDYTQANATFALARVTVDPTDFTQAAGPVDGRKLVIALQTLLGEATGNANHIALIDTVGLVLYYVTTCTLVGIVDTQNQDFSEWEIRLRAPT